MDLSREQYQALLDTGEWTPICCFHGNSLVMKFRTKHGVLISSDPRAWAYWGPSGAPRNQAMFEHCRLEAGRILDEMGGHKKMATMAAIARRLNAGPALVSAEEQSSD